MTHLTQPERSRTETGQHLRLVVLRTTLADDRVQQVDYLVLASTSSIELAAHLDEPLLHLTADVREVFARRVEAGRGGLAEVPDLATDLRDVAVGPTCQHARSCCVLLAVAHPVGQVLDFGLRRRHTGFQVVWLSHAQQLTEWGRSVALSAPRTVQLHPDSTRGWRKRDLGKLVPAVPPVRSELAFLPDKRDVSYVDPRRGRVHRTQRGSVGRSVCIAARVG